MPPKKRSPWRHAQIAPLKRLPSVRKTGPKCMCGDFAGEHLFSAGEFGQCLHHPCGCLRLRLPEEDLR